MDTLVDRAVAGWGIVVEGAPLRCASCDHAILGSGEGPVRVLLEAVTRHLAECHGLAGDAPEIHGASAEPVRIMLTWNSDYEQAFLDEVPAGDGGVEADEANVYEVELPAELWAAFTVAQRAYITAHRRIVELAGFDEETGRLAQPCPAWHGDLDPGQSSWSVLHTSTGPECREMQLAWRSTERDAVSLLESLPEEFHVLSSFGAGLELVRRQELRIERSGTGPWASACHRCGWARGEHERGSDTLP